MCHIWQNCQLDECINNIQDDIPRNTKNLYKAKLILIKFIHININCVHLNAGCCLTILRRKTNYSVLNKDIFDSSLHSINWCSSLFDCFVLIMSCWISNPTTIFHCEIYYSRQTMAHNFLSLWVLYSNILSCLPLLEYLSALIVK